jgi:hypothetical protein
MTEYQASNIAVEDTENSTLIEPCINIGSTLICGVDPTSFFNNTKYSEKQHR